MGKIKLINIKSFEKNIKVFIHMFKGKNSEWTFVKGKVEKGSNPLF